ncbi:MAG: hypothetical protein IKZ46_10440, partial [Victivallales bacterium]|nr:hypothetical protein [Victivallales bacterium]
VKPEAAVQPQFRPLPSTEQEELPALKITSAPHFLTPFQFTSWNGDQSAEVTEIDNGWIFRNANSGGDFGAMLPLEHVDLLQIAKLEFDFQASPDAYVNLYFSTMEDSVARYFITLSGPDYDGPNLYKISGIEKPKADEWAHVSIDLNRAIHAKYPWRNSWTLKSMMIGMLHEGYLNAGLNGNHRGATYQIRNIKLSSVKSSNVATRWLVASEQQPPEYRAWFATTADDSQKAPESTKVLKDITHLFKPASAEDKFLLVETKQEDGTWKRLTAYERPQPAEAQLIAEFIDPKPGQPWGGNPIVIQFKGAEDAVPLLFDAGLTIDKQSMTLNALNTVYDSMTRTLTITPLFSAFKADLKELTFSFNYQDCITVPAGKAVQADFAFDRAQDKTPPSRPVIKEAKTALAGLGFPDLEIGPNTTSSKLKVDYKKREDNQLPAAHVTNTVCGTDAAVAFKFPPFSANQYPFISFDYNIPDPQTYIDLIVTGSGRSAFGMTDKEAREDQYLQDIPNIQADGKWHRAIVDLRPYFDRRSTTFPQQSWNINQIAIGNFYYSGTEPGSTYAVSNMRLAQIVTTVNGPFALNWTSNDPSGIDGYSYVWDDKDDTMPDTKANTTLSSVSFEKLEPGLKYFHIRAVDKNGNWGPAAHYLYFVDNSAPKAIATMPMATSKGAADTVSITFNQDGGSMNFSGAMLEINGTQCTLNRANTTFDPKTRTLTWNMLSDNNLLGGPMKDGDAFIAKLTGVRNIAGVEAPPVEWSWNADFSQDKKPPLPPTVSTTGSNAFRHILHYSSNTPLWNNYRHADVEYVNDEITHSQCLQISLPDDITNRRFLYYMHRSITTADFPFLRFRYRIMPGTKVNLNFNIDQKYYTVKMTGSEENVESVIGTIPEAKDDGQWRWALLNLREMFAKAFPDKKDFSFYIMVFGDYGKPTEKSCMRIDDVAFVPELSPFQLYYFSSSDATGIAAFNADLTQDAEKTDLRQMNPKLLRSRIPVEIPDAKGLWFLAAQSQDGAGNRSETVMYPFFCSQPAIADSKTEGLEATTDGTPWRVRAFSATDKRTYCYSRLARTGQDNLVIASQFFGYPTPDVLFYRRLGKTLQQTPPRRIRADLHADAGEAYKVSVVLLDANLVPLAESEAKTMQADGVWHRKVIFNLPETQEPPIFLAFHLRMADKSRTLLSFDNIRNVKITPTAAKPADKPAAKPDDKPAAKPADKPVAAPKPDDKPAAAPKPADTKPAEVKPAAAKQAETQKPAAAKQAEAQKPAN